MKSFRSSSAAAPGTRLWPLSRALLPSSCCRWWAHAPCCRRRWRRGSRRRPRPTPAAGRLQRGAPVSGGWAAARGGARADLILEPDGRNTRPPSPLPRWWRAAERGGDVLLLVLPADHVIRDAPPFSAPCGPRFRPRLAGELVTFGVVPDRAGDRLRLHPRGARRRARRGASSSSRSRTSQTARGYVASGRHFWNSGMFLFTAGRVPARTAGACARYPRGLRAAVAASRRDGG